MRANDQNGPYNLRQALAYQKLHKPNKHHVIRQKGDMQEGNLGFLVTQIIDHGQGISQNDLKSNKLFSTFTQ